MRLRHNCHDFTFTVKHGLIMEVRLICDEVNFNAIIMVSENMNKATFEVELPDEYFPVKIVFERNGDIYIRRDCIIDD